MEAIIALGFGAVGCFIVRSLFRASNRVYVRPAVYVSPCYRAKRDRQCRSEWQAQNEMRAGIVR